MCSIVYLSFNYELSGESWLMLFKQLLKLFDNDSFYFQKIK